MVVGWMCGYLTLPHLTHLNLQSKKTSNDTIRSHIRPSKPKGNPFIYLHMYVDITICKVMKVSQAGRRSVVQWLNSRLDLCAGDPGLIPAGSEFPTGIWFWVITLN